MNTRRLWPLVLVAGCGVGGGGGAAPDASVDASVEDASRPAPDVLSPDAAQPDAARPDAAPPDAAEPDAAEPDAAGPDATPSDASLPDAAWPDGAAPPALECPLAGVEVCAGPPVVLTGRLTARACPPPDDCPDDGCCWQTRWEDYRPSVFLVHRQTGLEVEVEACREEAERAARLQAGEALPPFTWRFAASTVGLPAGAEVELYTGDGDWWDAVEDPAECYGLQRLALDGEGRACVDQPLRGYCQ